MCRKGERWGRGGRKKELKPELKEKTGEIGLGWNLCSLNNVA